MLQNYIFMMIFTFLQVFMRGILRSLLVGLQEGF